MKDCVATLMLFSGVVASGCSSVEKRADESSGLGLSVQDMASVDKVALLNEISITHLESAPTHQLAAPQSIENAKETAPYLAYSFGAGSQGPESLRIETTGEWCSIISLETPGAVFFASEPSWPSMSKVSFSEVVKLRTGCLPAPDIWTVLNDQKGKPNVDAPRL